MKLKCSGWWEQFQYGRQAMWNLTLSFDNGKITGTGVDIVGGFFFDGYLEREKIRLLKQYFGQHQIAYHGHSLGEGIYTGE